LTCYCIDTSSIIDAGERNYPIDIFPGFWEKMDDLVHQDRLKAPEILIDELKRQDDEWREWVYVRKDDIVISMDAAQQAAVANIMARPEFRPLVKKSGKSGGDPFFIALAQTHSMTLVTSEHMRAGGIRIPHVGAALNVNCINLLEMLRRESWRFYAGS